MAKDRKTIKRVFGGLFNNSVAIDGAKFSPWWVGLILFVLGILLPVVPLFVSAATTDGTSFLPSEYGLGLDKTFGIAMNDMQTTNTLNFNNEKKEISLVSTGSTPSNDGYMIGSYISSAGETAGQYELTIYYSNLTEETEISNFITRVEETTYAKNSTTPGDAYIPTSIYFFKNTFYMEIYGSNSTEKKATMGFMSDLNCLDYDGGSLNKYFCGQSFNKDNKEDRVNAYNKLKEFIDITYDTRKTQNMWLGSLLYVGVFVGINLMMALMVFLMSRGKNNPNNYLNFWQCIKIDWWESLAPGILGLVLGFIFTSNAVMIYVMLIAMRTMWLTTKELRPQY